MNCALCHKNAATVPLKHVVHGVTKELPLCEACAAAKGFNQQLPLPPLTDLLFGVGAPAGPLSDDPVCKTCHLHQTDFHKNSLLGCPDCYTAFEPEIEDLLLSMHRGLRHTGKAPRRRMAGYLRALEADIERAEREQDTELADRLRAHLRERVRASAERALKAGAEVPAGGEVHRD
jgi:protein arginine kinase activator